MNVGKVDPKLQFAMEKIDEQMRKGYAIEASPLGPFYSLRFFNEIESVMLLANREQMRQIHTELGRALDLAQTRQARRRAKTPR